jgi:hypothetical protein
MQQYYLRARWYDQQTGRFNRIDPFAGNNQDPQSLHKYLYAHNNPINATDPSGMFSVVSFALTTLNVVGIAMTVMSITLKAVGIGLGFTQLDALGDFMRELWRAPVPSLMQKIMIRNLIGTLAIEIVGKVVGLALDILKIGISILAWSILCRATIGFLRSMKGAASLAKAAKSSGSITDPSRLLPAPKIHKHHIFPKQFSKFFSKAGIYIDDYAVQIEQTTHLKGVHGKGMGKMPGKWNQIWKNFFSNNPSPTAKHIFQQAGKMMDDFGLSDLPIGSS